MGPRPKADGGIAVIRLTHQVVAVVCEIRQLSVAEQWLAGIGFKLGRMQV